MNPCTFISIDFLFWNQNPFFMVLSLSFKVFLIRNPQTRVNFNQNSLTLLTTATTLTVQFYMAVSSFEALNDPTQNKCKKGVVCPQYTGYFSDYFIKFNCQTHPCSSSKLVELKHELANWSYILCYNKKKGNIIWPFHLPLIRGEVGWPSYSGCSWMVWHFSLSVFHFSFLSMIELESQRWRFWA